MGTRPGAERGSFWTSPLLTQLPSGLACLQSEERTALALQRSLTTLARAHVRVVQSVRVHEALALLSIFGGGRHGALAELVAAASESLRALAWLEEGFDEA